MKHYHIGERELRDAPLQGFPVYAGPVPTTRNRPRQPTFRSRAAASIDSSTRFEGVSRPTTTISRGTLLTGTSTSGGSSTAMGKICIGPVRPIARRLRADDADIVINGDLR